MNNVWRNSCSVEARRPTALGRDLEGRTKVLLAQKPMRGWTSVFTPIRSYPRHSCGRWPGRRAFTLYHRRDDTFYASRSYVCPNAARGERTLRFPHPADLFDPLTGQRLARRVTEFSHHFADKEALLARSAT